MISIASTIKDAIPISRNSTHLFAVFVCALSSLSFCSSVYISGKIASNDSRPIRGASVRLVIKGISDSTDEEGKFHLPTQSTGIALAQNEPQPSIEFYRGIIKITCSSAIRNAELSIFDPQGKRLCLFAASKQTDHAWSFNLHDAMPRTMTVHGMCLVRLTLNSLVYYFKTMGVEHPLSDRPTISATYESASKLKGNAKIENVGVFDTLIVRKDGFINRRLPVSIADSNMGIIWLGKQFSVIDSNLVDAEYSARLDMIVGACSSPSRVVLFTPQTEQKTVLTLNKPPKCVSVSPDGKYAVVGHDAMISYIDLDEKTIKNELFISNVVMDIVLGTNGYSYSFPLYGSGWYHIYSTNLTTGKETTGGALMAGTKGRMHPSGKYIYGAQTGLSIPKLQRYNINADTISDMYDAPDGNYGANLWITDDGTKFFSMDGRVYSCNPDKSLDMLRLGTLNCGPCMWLAQSSNADCIALLPIVENSNICFYDQKSYGFIGTLTLTDLAPVQDGTTRKAVFNFFSRDGNACTVLFNSSNHVFSAYTINEDQYPKARH